MIPISKEETIIADSPMISTSNIAASSAPGAVSIEDAAGATADHQQEQLPPSPQTDPQAPALAQASAQGPPLGSVFLRRLCAVPLVRGLGGVCGRVAGWPLVGCTLSLVGQAARLVSAPAVAVVGPVAGVCAVPAACVDWCACKGLDVVEQIVPCLFVPSDEVFASCGTCLADCACCLPKAGAKAVSSVCQCGEQEKQNTIQ